MKTYKVSYRVGNMPKGEYQYLTAHSKAEALKQTTLIPALSEWEKPFLRWSCEPVK